jgi:hypothetical protein
MIPAVWSRVVTVDRLLKKVGHGAYSSLMTSTPWKELSGDPATAPAAAGNLGPLGLEPPRFATWVATRVNSARFVI